jgi:colanic acid biosynthesis glycosyl transferase WcaI
LRILIYGLNYAPELTGIGKYTGELANWLSEKGHEVRVVAAPPYYPEWTIRSDYKRHYFLVERPEKGPTVYRVPLFVPKQPTGIKRLLHLASFAACSVPIIVRSLFWKPDVVWTVAPALASAPVAVVASLLCGAQSWLHIQDFELEAAFELGIFSTNSLLQKLLGRIESLIFSSFDRVSSISKKMVDKAKTKCLDPNKVELLPNWVEVNDIFPLSTPNAYRASLDLRDKIVILYSGNMGEKQGLNIVAPVAREFVDDSRIHFVLCGEGAYRAALEQEVAGLPNVTLLMLQPLENLNELLNLADIHLLLQRPGAADLVMPSKLTGMFSSGKSVIATAASGTEVATAVAGRGLVIPPGDPAALIAAICVLAADENLRAELGRAGRAYAVSNLSRDSILGDFELRLLALAEANMR